MLKLNGEAMAHFGDYFNLDFVYEPTKLAKKDPTKDLAIADVHAPFHHEELLDKAINDNLDAENLIIAGDFWDFYSKSYFRKTADIKFEYEFAVGYRLLRELSYKFKKVYLMLSNHDERFKKHIFNNVPTDLLNFCHYNIVEDIIKKTLPNVIIAKQRVNHCNREVGYIKQIKNIVFTHIEKSNKDITKTVQELSKDFVRWGGYFNLKDYDMIIQAHNHQSGRVKYGDLTLCQIPCMIDISKPAFDYVFNGKIIGNPPALGYMVLRKNGKYDPKKSYIVDLN
jgi:hypothetical protein